jgi:hypothetical protein
MATSPKIELVLYVSEGSTCCETAARNLKRLLRRFDSRDVVWRIRNISTDPLGPADTQPVVMTPTLLIRTPTRQRFLGELGEIDRVAEALRQVGVLPRRDWT